jgi:hypothetical protein
MLQRKKLLILTGKIGNIQFAALFVPSLAILKILNSLVGVL